MTSAYHEADGTGHSDDLRKLRLIDRFGVRAVLGRDALYAGETFRMIAAENVYHAKRANMNSDSWADWAKNNPKAADLLAEVEKLVNTDG